MKRTTFALMATMLVTPTVAAPPENSDGRMAEYFHGLTLPGLAPGYCCKISDCRPVQSRWVDSHWEVFIDEATYGKDSGAPNAWMVVPPEIYVAPNPAPLRPTQPVACWYQQKLRCFDKPVAEG